MTPDPSSLFKTASHQEALSGLTYAVLESKGFVVLTGEVGTGKTTVLSSVLRFIPRTRAVFSMILSPTLNPDEFLEAILTDFGIEEIPPAKIHRLMRLQQFLTESHTSGRTCVLVVDEAHKLSPAVLEEIRLLTNFENAQRKLLQIVLVGQRELVSLLNQEDLRQLKQRIALRFELQPLSMSEVDQYMRFRWVNAGSDQELPFDVAAIRAIGTASHGLPRLINALCDNALILAFGTGVGRVTAAHASQAIRDLDLALPDEPVGTPKLNGAPPSGQLRLPPPVGVVEPLKRPLVLSTLERYGARGRKAPLLMRWAGRLKLANVERHS